MRGWRIRDYIHIIYVCLKLLRLFILQWIKEQEQTEGIDVLSIRQRDLHRQLELVVKAVAVGIFLVRLDDRNA